MSDSDIVSCMSKFYSVVNKVIDNNVFNQRSGSCTYPEWCTGRLIKRISDKKVMHVKWEEQIVLRRQNGQLYGGHLVNLIQIEI